MSTVTVTQHWTKPDGSYTGRCSRPVEAPSHEQALRELDAQVVSLRWSNPTRYWFYTLSPDDTGEQGQLLYRIVGLAALTDKYYVEVHSEVLIEGVS